MERMKVRKSVLFEDSRGQESTQTSQKSISERRKLKILIENLRPGRVFIMSQLIIYILLLVQLIAQLQQLNVQATSQISSTWVNRDEQVGPSLKFQWPAQVKTEVGASKSSLSKPAKALANVEGNKKQVSLAAAASSLYPAVAEVEIEPFNGTQLKQQVAQRRSSQPILASSQFRLAHVMGHNLRDDQQQQPPLPAGMKQARSNQTQSNQQVQFDEEQQNQEAQLTRRRQLVPKPLIEDFETTRRQENETTLSNLAPKHAEFQSDEIHFDEPVANQTGRSRADDARTLPSPPPPPTTTTSDNLELDLNLADERNTSTGFTRRPEPVAGIYYLPDGDKWNSDGGGEDIGRHRPDRKQFAGKGVARGPMINLMETEKVSPSRADEFLEMTNFAHQNDTFPDFNTLARPHDNRPHLEFNQNRVSSLADPNRWPLIGPGYISGPLDQTRTKIEFGELKPAPRPPTRIPASIGMPFAAYNQQKQTRPLANFNQLQQPFNLMAPIYHSIRVASGTRRPQTLHHLLGGISGHNQDAFAQSIRRSRPATRDQIVHLGGTAHQAGGSQKSSSFLRSYNPMQLIGGGSTKPKKSLLSNINEKLSHWVGDSSATSNRDEMRLLEGAFFEPNSRPILRDIAPLLPNQFKLSANFGPIRQPTVAPVASTIQRFYGRQSVGSSGNSRRTKLHQGGQRPNRARGGSGYIQHQGSRQAASFIPVVAVQVTRTSPAPNSMNSQQEFNFNEFPDGTNSLNGATNDATQSSAANEIDQYLAAKLSPAQNQYDANERQKWDDSQVGSGGYLDYTSSMSGRNWHHKQQAPTSRNSAHQRPPFQHETTVKGAVFGYLPHQADAPLMQAMSMLQQLPLIQAPQPVAGNQLPNGRVDSTATRPLDQLADVYSNTNENYANQMDKSSQAADAATSLMDYQSLAAVTNPLQAHQMGPMKATNLANDDQPSLALQLQANNFVQNDQIAHPFGGGGGVGFNSVPAVQHQLAGLGPDKRFEPAPQKLKQPLNFGQQNQHQLQLSPLQLLAQNTPQASQEQLAQFLTNPLLGQNQLDAYQQLLAAASPTNEQLNPFIMNYNQQVHQFQPLDSFYDTSATNHKDSNMMQQRPLEDNSQASNNMNMDSETNQAESSLHNHRQPEPSNGEQMQVETTRNQALNTKGRKRSSEFFANAGQLLLSALPLLLAPTLGYMFAAAPSIPAARYHGLGQLNTAPNHQGGSWFNSQDLHENGAPFGDGLVVNASPEPQMFTPRPPGSYHPQEPQRAEPIASYSNINNGQLASTNQSQSQVGSRPTASGTTAATTSTTTARPRGLYKSSASLPALTGLTWASPSSSSRPSASRKGGGQSTKRPLRVVPTTLEPAIDFNSTSQVDELELVSSSNKSHEILDPQNQDNEQNATDSTTFITPTLLLIETTQPEADQPEVGTTLTNSSDRHFGDEAAKSNRRMVSSTEAPKSTMHYDVGYQGADFDAQFPTLRKPSNKIASELNKLVRNKSQYQYDQVQPERTSLPPSKLGDYSSEPSINQVDAKWNASQDLGNQQQDVKLYPVSTWPSQRRRTVSLITSSGNRTVAEFAGSNSRRHFSSRPKEDLVERPTRSRPLSETTSGASGRRAADSTQFELDESLGKLSNESNSFLVETLNSERANRRLIWRIRRKREVASEPPNGTESNRTANSTESNSDDSSGDANNLNGSKKATRMLLKKRKLNKKRLERRQDSPVEQLSSSSWPIDAKRNATAASDEMNGDASKRKSAIVTAMITQVGDNEQDSRVQGEIQRDGTEADDNLDDEDQLAYQELREQMAKKLMLDQMATRVAAAAAAAAAAASESADSLTDETDSLQSGGRGRFKPVPVLSYSNQQQLEQQPRRLNYSATRFVSGRSRFRPRVSSSKANSIELNDKTKRALAKFGSLLLEDTLQIPGRNNETGQQHSLTRSKYSTGQQLRSSALPMSSEQQEISATERYSARATTQVPLVNPNQIQDNWSQFYADRNQTLVGRPYEQATRPAGPLNGHPHSQWRFDRFEPARRQRPDFGGNGHAYPPTGNSSSSLSGADYDEGNQAVAFKHHTQFKQPANEPIHEQAGELHPPAANNSSQDQLDARYSTYSNYSTSAPYHQHEYFAPPTSSGRRHEPSPGHYPDERDPAHGHHFDAHRSPPSHYSNNQSSSYNDPPPYYNSQRQTPPPNYQPFAYQQRPNQPPVQDNYHRGYSSAPAAYPAAVDSRNYGLGPANPTHLYDPNYYSPAHNNPHNHYDHHHPRHHPSLQPPTGPASYTPAPSSLAPHQTLGASYQHSYAGDRLNAATSRSAPADSSSQRSINDYLKRAQFSDSDRDKLMASYLTCDGLLRDSDHCLERLSCEFSDPKNIEKANKLDRAVSSILLGHILINSYIPSAFKLRLKSASLFGYTQSGKCSKFACSKLAKQAAASQETISTQAADGDETPPKSTGNEPER